ncbi:Homeobox protein cut [Armadillidium vulgare]|nr:Homeobox protein cut [Armadillidium vulgare]
MLTQKGREPFIRMKMFLEDDNAVHKLVASQYKIAPEKLMRTGGYGIPPPSTSKPHHIKLPPDLPKTSLESPLPPVGIPSSLGLTLPPHPHAYDARMPLLDPLRKVFPFQAGLPSIRVPGPVAPSVYEMAALTQDLDTQVITTKIKEALLANNIGQKLFGEAVLGLSQGSVSELLSKPKPWHMLSIKGREPFIRMQLWLNDPHNVEKLQTLKNERREANKRRRGLDPSAEVSSDSHDVFQAPSPGGSSKKARVLFSEEQKEALRLAFALDPYPNLAAIEFLSQELQLSTRTITNWFHNHRMRLKQHPGSPDGGISSPPRDLPNPSQTPFDPLHFRIMLSQRLMELRKEKGLPPTLPGLGAGLPTSLHPGFFSPMPPFSMANLSISPSDRYASGGLDLSMKNEHDGDDSNASFIDDDSNISGGMSPNGNRSDGDDFGDDQDRNDSTSPVARPSSRRKPAAPQWVNPSWAVGNGEKEREVIINGVCVMQTDDYRQNSEQETVLIEPTSVEEARRSLLESVPTPEREERTCTSDNEVSTCPVSIKEDPINKEEDGDLPASSSSSSPSKSENIEVNGGSEYQTEIVEEQPKIKSETDDA